MFRLHVVCGVFQRNVQQYFSSVSGYLFIVVFVTSCALLAFNPRFFAENLANLDQLSQFFPLLLLFLIPAISMGVWADERKQGTDSLLFTLPASDFEILLGKYLAIVAVYTIALLFSLTQLIPLSWLGNPDYGVIVATYIGYWLVGVALLSVGMFASSLTSSSTIAFILGALFCAVPVLIGYFFGGYTWLKQWSVPWHLKEFTLGLIPLEGVVYFATIVVLFLYLNLVVITRRHWSRGQQFSLAGHFVVRIAALIVAVFAVNLIFTRANSIFPGRMDLTSEQRYSLHPTSRAVIQRARQNERPVTVQAFISRDMPPQLINTRKYLTGLLRQFDRVGGNNLDVRFVDIDPASYEVKEAKQVGIEPRTIRYSKGGQTVEQEVFMGAVVTSSLDEVVLSNIERESSLEYRLTRAIATTTSKEKRLTVGILETDLNFAGLRWEGNGQAEPAILDWGFEKTMEAMRKHYNVVRVSADDLGRWADRLKQPVDDSQPDADEPSDTQPNSSADATDETAATESWRQELPDVLLVAGPSSLDNATMLDLITYLRQGQPALILADPLPFHWQSKAPDFFGIVYAPSQPRTRPQMGFPASSYQMPKANLGLSVADVDDSEASIQANVQLGNQPNSFFDVVFRYSDELNYWSLRLTSSGNLQLIKHIDGNEQSIESLELPNFDPLVAVELEVELRDNQIAWKCGMTEGQIEDRFNRQATWHGVHVASAATLLNSFQIHKLDAAETAAGDAEGTASPLKPKEAPRTLFSGDFRGRCSLLCQTLGIRWPYDQVAWQLYNPHPDFEPVNNALVADQELPEFYGPNKFLMLFATSYSDHEAFNAEDAITRGLSEMLLVQPGAIEPRQDSQLTFQPLISLTAGDSGLTPLDELTTNLQVTAVNPLTGETQTQNVPSFATGSDLLTMDPEAVTRERSQQELVLAARIQGDNLHAVYVADSDFLAEFSHVQAAELEQNVDNLAFLENAIESLAGDSRFVGLRNRRPTPRTLTEFEKSIEQFRQQRAARDEQATRARQKKLDSLREKIAQVEEQLSNDSEMSMMARRQQEAIVAQQSSVELRRTERRLEEELEKALQDSRIEERRQIAARENWTTAISVLFAPLPALLLGIVVFFVKWSSERSQVTSERKVTGGSNGQN